MQHNKHVLVLHYLAPTYWLAAVFRLQNSLVLNISTAEASLRKSFLKQKYKTDSTVNILFHVFTISHQV